MYAIIDIETTGGSPIRDRITEIAVFLYDGNTILQAFHSLINPETGIPYPISRLTGITNEMVAHSPKFFEIARELVLVTEGRTFVAHNVNFDYRFIKYEFKRLGYNYQRNQLCTLQLSRKYIKGLPSYSLTTICKHLNIINNNRHRASGDAYATAILFDHLIKCKSGINIQSSLFLQKISNPVLHPCLDEQKIGLLPEKPGVYFFLNSDGEIIYIGKSINIKERILVHIRDFSTKKAIEMKKEIAKILFEITGSELVALLKESQKIKEKLPLYNRKQRKSGNNFGIYYFYNDSGYLCFQIENNKQKNTIPLYTFSSKKEAREFLERKITQFRLCQKLCGLYPSMGSCFHYEIMECKGACIGKESPDKYNSRAQQLLQTYPNKFKSFFIVEKGRQVDELALIFIENGQYRGYGFIAKNEYESDKSKRFGCIQKYEDNRDIQQIISGYILKNEHCIIMPVD